MARDEKKVPETLGLLKLLKGLEGRNQKQLGIESGVSQSVISEFMNESLPLREGITAAAVVNLCKALKVDPMFVLIGEGDLIPEFAWAAAATGQHVDISEEDAPLEPPPEQRSPSSTPEQITPKRAGRTSQSPGP